MLKHFAEDTGQGYWPIIGWFGFVPLFKDRGYIGLFPDRWESPIRKTTQSKRQVLLLIKMIANLERTPSTAYHNKDTERPQTIGAT